MGLESRYKESFSKSQKDIGEGLYLSSSVTYIQGNESSVSAEVAAAGDLFEVVLKCPQKELKLHCDCLVSQNAPCEHSWAVLLASDRLNLLKNAYKRGARLFGTAAAKKELAKPVKTEKHLPLYFKQNSAQPAVSHEVVDKHILYVINKKQSKPFHHISIELFWRPLNDLKPIKPYLPDLSDTSISEFDQRIVSSLLTCARSSGSSLIASDSEALAECILNIFRAGTLYTREDSGQFKFAKVKDELSAEIEWTFSLSPDGYEINANCFEQSLKSFYYVSQTLLILPRAIVHTDSQKSKLIFKYLHSQGNLVPPWEVEGFLNNVLIPSGIDLKTLPGRLKCERDEGLPRGHIFIRTAKFKFRDKEQLHADLSFHYSGKLIPENDKSEEVLDFYKSKVLKRNLQAEQKLKGRLCEMGFRFNEESHKEEYGWKLVPSRLPEVVDLLLAEDWSIIAEGKSYKAPQSFQLRLSSGEDWFELSAEAVFEDEKILIPELMQAAEKTERYVELGDGSFGVLPEEWLKHYTVLTQLGELVGDNLRFRKSQGLIIEHLLQNLLESQEGLDELKSQLENKSRFRMLETPDNFNGKLRPYQKQGLSWLSFLKEARIGGILADDMGLGKTIQILALLVSIKEKLSAPVLLIVPRSLIFNWIEEAKTFTPSLSIMEYSGSGRKQLFKQLHHYNIVVTTYGTVRQDVEKLSKINFEYCILDEAQAIKNRDSSTHKAVRLINAKNRISMSGTPVENSLSDLISQFEFLNPGITGQGKLANLIAGDEKLNKETLEKLRDSFKPFILRRTKAQVAKDLPPKTEQIVYCKMDGPQRRMYEKMLKFYQQEMAKSEKEGKSNIEYLGALTRLRQMSCHPQLVSEDWLEQGSAKLEVLINKLKEIISEGHRALIFSQFTSFLSLIKKELEEHKWSYCYLDGKTKNRQEVVETFQNSEIPLFLISLKAGGVGLNLTAADYVFIMDPWWNPAIENQAVDRAYRIGQKKQVIACKLITQGTVEEKVLKMQKVKKYLAGSLVDENNDMITKLSTEDFKQLLY